MFLLDSETLSIFKQMPHIAGCPKSVNRYCRSEHSENSEQINLVHSDSRPMPREAETVSRYVGPQSVLVRSLNVRESLGF